MGRIFDIQRFCIHDGPGIRTTVFLKGCPLSCPWCHNPEGRSMEPSLSFLPTRCIGCKACAEVCSMAVHRWEEKKHLLDRERCVICGCCAEACYAKALEMVGKDMTALDVLQEVLKDLAFYKASGGGMTLSGGEPTQQSDFGEELLQRAKGEGLHTCVETCGVTSRLVLERWLPWVDLFLYDYKETDSDRHRQTTGASRALVLEHLKFLDQNGKPLWLRCPILPGINDREDHLEGIVQVAQSFPSIQVVELMPYNPLGESKVERFGLCPQHRMKKARPNEKLVDQWKQNLEHRGVRIRPQ